ncbi:MAG: hypothetical protein MZU91_12465 [Desulfosudis oleivorans]|nr:hypothetical protein [Desulfosudis oleivorans]
MAPQVAGPAPARAASAGDAASRRTRRRRPGRGRALQGARLRQGHRPRGQVEAAQQLPVSRDEQPSRPASAGLRVWVTLQVGE